MKKLYINGNKLKRYLSITFDTSFDISYEDFIEGNYDNIIGDILWSFGEMIWDSRSLEKTWYSNSAMKFDFLLNYDLLEEYTGFLTEKDLFNFFWVRYAEKQWFCNEQMNREIDQAKSFINNNEFTLHKDYLGIRIFPGQRKISNTYKSLYKEKRIKNRYYEYLKLITVLSVDPIHIIYQIHNDDFIIVSADRMNKYLGGSCLTKNANELFALWTPQFLKELLMIKEKYKKAQNKLAQMFIDIKELIDKVPTWTIKIHHRNQKIETMLGDFIDTNTNNLQKHQDFIGWYGFIAPDLEHGSRKRLKWQKRYNYKDWKNTSKQ